jgi:hypothetical protein
VRHPIEFDPEASLELDQAARWYEDQRSGLGSDFLRASGRTIERLAEQRVLGLRIPALDRSSLVRRAAVPRFPYQIVFEVIDGVLLVLAVAHSGHMRLCRPGVVGREKDTAHGVHLSAMLAPRPLSVTLRANAG